MSMLAFISTGWLIFIGLLVLVGLYNFVIAPMLARQSYARIARELGLSYDPEAKLQGVHGCEELHALRIKRPRRNLLRGTLEGVETVVVELGAPGSELFAAEMAYGGLVALRQPGRALPVFQVFKHSGSPEKALNDPEFSAGGHTIEVRDNPGFPDFFVLVAQRMQDTEAVRALFTRSAQDFFMEHRDFIQDVQGAGEWVGVVESTFFFDVSPWSATKNFREEVAAARRVHEVFARATA